MSDHKAHVRRLVDDVMNGNDLESLDELCSAQHAPKLRTAFTQFRTAFPDWHQELIELVAEDATVVTRFRCTGTHRGACHGLEPSGRAMRIDEVYFFSFARRPDIRHVGTRGHVDDDASVGRRRRHPQ